MWEAFGLLQTDQKHQESVHQDQFPTRHLMPWVRMMRCAIFCCAVTLLCFQCDCLAAVHEPNVNIEYRILDRYAIGDITDIAIDADEEALKSMVIDTCKPLGVRHLDVRFYRKSEKTPFATGTTLRCPYKTSIWYFDGKNDTEIASHLDGLRLYTRVDDLVADFRDAGDAAMEAYKGKRIDVYGVHAVIDKGDREPYQYDQKNNDLTHFVNIFNSYDPHTGVHCILDPNDKIIEKISTAKHNDRSESNYGLRSGSMSVSGVFYKYGGGLGDFVVLHQCHVKLIHQDCIVLYKPEDF